MHVSLLYFLIFLFYNVGSLISISPNLLLYTPFNVRHVEMLQEKEEITWAFLNPLDFLEVNLVRLKTLQLKYKSKEKYCSTGNVYS